MYMFIDIDVYIYNPQPLPFPVRELGADMAKFGLSGIFRGQGIGIFKAIISLTLFHEGRLFIARQFKAQNVRNGKFPAPASA